MARIRSSDTGPEMRVRRAAHAAGLRFRLHRRSLPGTPDVVFPGAKVAVFVHGCFWHRHERCLNCTTPKTRPEFWQAKFDANVARDGHVRNQLAEAGWRVVTIWECETRRPEILAGRIKDLKSLLSR